MGIPIDSIDNPAHSERIDIGALLKECKQATLLALENPDNHRHTDHWLRSLVRQIDAAVKTF